MRRKLVQLRNAPRSRFSENKAVEYSSVQKAIGILLSFIPDNKAMGNLELSKSLGLNKSTVSRLIRVLTHYGLMQQDQETQKYELGRTSALLGMAVEVSQSERLAQLGKPYIDYVRDTVGESVCLEVLHAAGHNKVVCAAVGPPPLSVIWGATLPINVSAGTKVILAFSDPDFTESMINGDFRKITDNTITDSRVFKAQLEEIRREGIAYEHGEFDPDVHGASVAVFNHLKKPVAALTICVPANRSNKIADPKNIELMKRTAMMISGRLFYESPKKR
jgi:IclR family KDG regulon transcriptional repressor